MTGLREPIRLAAPAGGPGRRRVVELAGLAASGKTSLLRALAGQEPAWRAGLRPPKHGHAWSAATLLPDFVALHRSARRILWKEMKRMTYLRTLRRELEAEAWRPGGAVILDEGPVYMMARMRMYGGAAVRSERFEAWWERAGEEWGRLLDLVIRLDAPDAVLTQRLRGRAQRHRLQAASDRQIDEFLTSYRAAYAEVVAVLERHGVRVLEVRTDREAPERIAERVSRVLREAE